MITIKIPSRTKLLKQTCRVSAVKGCWQQRCLQGNQGKRGVYVFHQKRRILYIGKTGGRSMTFGARLRRHFQESAAQGRHLWPQLWALKQSIAVSFVPEETIRKSISGIKLKKPRLENEAIELMEAALILAWKPKWQETREQKSK
jgi:hypothetical protein